MNEHQASIAIRRRPEIIEREIEARRQTMSYLRELAAEFAAMDMRPFVVHPESLTITYLRNIDYPEELLTHLHDEARAIYELEQELYAR